MSTRAPFNIDETSANFWAGLGCEIALEKPGAFRKGTMATVPLKMDTFFAVSTVNVPTDCPPCSVVCSTFVGF